MAMIVNPKESGSACFALSGRDLLLKEGGKDLSFNDLCELKAKFVEADFFDEPSFGVCAIDLGEGKDLPSGYELKTIRQYFAEHAEEDSFRLARARALLAWRRDWKFCGKCGAPLQDHAALTARVCPQCGKVYFPRIEPCVIVLVNRGDKILLARHKQRNQDIYACIAGFMEVGESAEHAVRREIMEEVGITVKNVRYRGSQSWPFPDQLMLAFTAEYESGEIKLQKDELSDARWFDRENCPASPQPGSIAYKLIHNEI